MSLHLFNLPLTLKYLILYKYIILSFEKSLIRYQNCIRMFCLFSLSSTLYLIFGESNSNMAFHFLIFIFKTMNNINIHLYFFTAICISLNVNLKFYLSLIRWNPLSTTNWHLPATSARIKSCAAAAADFQHPLKGFQGGEQKWGTLCPGKTSRTGLQIVRYFQEPISSYLEKH